MGKVYIGNMLKKMRNEENLTLDELVNRLNSFAGEKAFNKGTISKWENGKEEPRLSTLKIIADFYSVSIDTFNTEMNKSSSTEYPDLFLPEHAALAHRFVRDKRPLGANGINLNAMTDEQAIAYANLIKKADRLADEEAEIHVFRAAIEDELKKK